MVQGYLICILRLEPIQCLQMAEDSSTPRNLHRQLPLALGWPPSSFRNCLLVTSATSVPIAPVPLELPGHRSCYSSWSLTSKTLSVTVHSWFPYKTLLSPLSTFSAEVSPTVGTPGLIYLKQQLQLPSVLLSAQFFSVRFLSLRLYYIITPSVSWPSRRTGRLRILEYVFPAKIVISQNSVW